MRTTLRSRREEAKVSGSGLHLSRARAWWSGCDWSWITNIRSAPAPDKRETDAIRMSVVERLERFGGKSRCRAGSFWRGRATRKARRGADGTAARSRLRIMKAVSE
eukprot:190435-Rhodomonas_salina.1